MEIVKRDRSGRILPSGDETKSKLMTFKVTPTFYRELREYCDKHGLSLIEVFTKGIYLVMNQSIQSNSTQDAPKTDRKFKNDAIQAEPTKTPAFKHPTLFEHEDNPSDQEQGLTDAQLAEELKVSRVTVTRWRNGKRTPSGLNSDLFSNWEIRGKLWHKKL